MTRFLMAMILVVGLSAQTASAQFGGMPKVGGGGGLSAAEMDKFIKDAKAAKLKMLETEAALYPLVASKEAADDFNRKLKAAKEWPNPAERDSKVVEVEEQGETNLDAIDFNSPEVTDRVKNAPPDVKKNIAVAITNFLGAAATDISLAKQGKALAAKKPDMSAASKMPDLTNAAADVAKQATSAVKVANGLQRLVTVAKVDVPADSFTKVLNSNFP